MTTSLVLKVPGKPPRVTLDDPNMLLLYALRNGPGLHGRRFGSAPGPDARRAV
jgi:hypothetical protein